ncbi:MAG: hypothetical protein ACE5Q6_01190 [Dehalococcoidia bacterium]
MKRVERLRGMQDLSQEAWLGRRDLQDRLQESIGSNGYQLLEMPILEPTRLFLWKSGGILASQSYSFIQAGGNPVSLRPAFSSPIMRYCLEHADEVDLPACFKGEFSADDRLLDEAQLGNSVGDA